MNASNEAPTPSPLQERLAALRSLVAASDVVACGGEHEQRILDVFGSTKAELFTAFRTGRIYSQCERWRCPAAAVTLNCAHRSSRLGPYVYRHEIHELTRLGILDQAWNELAAQLAEDITRYDAWIASDRLNGIPSLEERLQKQQPLLQKLSLFRQALLNGIDAAAQAIELNEGELTRIAVPPELCPA